MAWIFFVGAIVCYIIGLVQFFSPSPQVGRSQTRASLGQRTTSPRSADSYYAGTLRRGPNSIPAPRSETQSGRSLIASQGVAGGSEPVKLAWIKTSQRISVRHPQKGQLNAQVLGRVLYAELWQQQRGSQNPWVPTGSTFGGFWLEGNLFLLNWQNRFYLLDQSVDVSDVEIQRDFAPHARKFAQSDQTADVYFDYPPAVWHIDDIGKFRVEVAAGQGLRCKPGAIGRFIHASGDSGRALVVEDYEGGGSGQDTVWIGYRIEEQDVAGSHS
jgi:hypothetical protein